MPLGGLTLEAKWTPIEYTITFFAEDGETVLESSKVAYGTVPTAPNAPVKASTVQYTYEFAGWDKTIVVVTGDAIYKATYTPIERFYTIH